MVEYLASKRQSLNTLQPNLKMLIYGEPGTGKTVAAMKIAQAITPEGKSIEFLDFLEGWTSLLNHKGLTDRTNRQQYEGLSQIEALSQAIDEKLAPFDTIGTVILDEFSAMANADLDTVLRVRMAADRSGEDVPAWPDYHANKERTRKAITKLLSSNINVILVAHTKEDKDNTTGAVTTKPAFIQSFYGVFSQMLHVVANLTAVQFAAKEDGTQEYRRIFQVNPTKRVSAKTRVGGLPVTVEYEPLIHAIIEWMKGKRETVSEEVTKVIQPDISIDKPVETMEDLVAINVD